MFHAHAISFIEGFDQDGIHFVLHACTFEREMRDDAAHLISNGGVDRKRIKPRLGAKRVFIPRGVELPIIQVMKKRGKLHDKKIRFFVFADRDSILPDTIDMPPIVTG